MSEEKEMKSEISVTKLRRGRKPKASKELTRENGTIVTACCTPDNLKYINDVKLRTGHSTNRIINEALAFVAKKDGLSHLSERVPASVQKAKDIIAAYEKKLKNAGH